MELDLKSFIDGYQAKTTSDFSNIEKNEKIVCECRFIKTLAI